MKTIKQIADELGVSKTAVRKYMTDEVKTKYTETVSGTIYIDETGESIIKLGFKKLEPQTKFSGVSANQFAEVSSEVSALVSMLQHELDIKNHQLEEKDRRIDELIDTIASMAGTAQALHAGTIQSQITDGQTASARKNWWQFWKKPPPEEPPQ